MKTQPIPKLSGNKYWYAIKLDSDFGQSFGAFDFLPPQADKALYVEKDGENYAVFSSGSPILNVDLIPADLDFLQGAVVFEKGAG